MESKKTYKIVIKAACELKINLSEEDYLEYKNGEIDHEDVFYMFENMFESGAAHEGFPRTTCNLIGPFDELFKQVKSQLDEIE